MFFQWDNGTGRGGFAEASGVQAILPARAALGTAAQLPGSRFMLYRCIERATLLTGFQRAQPVGRRRRRMRRVGQRSRTGHPADACRFRGRRAQKTYFRRAEGWEPRQGGRWRTAAQCSISLGLRWVARRLLWQPTVWGGKASPGPDIAFSERESPFWLVPGK